MTDEWHRTAAVLAPAKWRAQATKEILMARQPVPQTTVEPDVYLSRWRIFETDDGLQRLVGYDSVDRGRVSSALVTLNQETMRVQSSDGLIYRLLGEPGNFWDVIDTWDIWFHTITRGQGGAVKDVTEQMCGKSVGDDDA
ncbi:hypothetical protein PQR75_16245 [Paraburkholderia fungorum]|uniref:hypothetical protein n=1 Tax=Paraburkholderia TaxID=1822464 RepID=UPI0038BAE4E5